MTDLGLSSTSTDAQAIAAVIDHHCQMSGEFSILVANQLDTAYNGEAGRARDRLSMWCHKSLIPHVIAEEKTIYRAARELPHTRLLVESMLAEHRRIFELVNDLDTAHDPLSQVTTGKALQELFLGHLKSENEQILPALAASSQYSVAQLLEGMHEMLGDDEEQATRSSERTVCCGNV